MRRFKMHEAAGRRCVLLTFTDHDPGGLHIAEKMRKNLEDLSRAVGWSPDNLVIIRFGLNADFIDGHGLTWIDNLETSSGGQLDDPDHTTTTSATSKTTSPNLACASARPTHLCEPEIGRKLCRDAILEYVPADAVQRYERKLDRVRKRLQRALRERVS